MTEYNAANTRHIRAAEKAAKVASAERAVVIGNLMSSKAGRAYVFERLERCFIFHTPFTGVDAQTNFNCGVQNVGLQELLEIQLTCPDQYIMMMREASDKEQANGRRRDDSTNSNDRLVGDQPDRGRGDNDNPGDGGVESEYEPTDTD